MVPGPENMGDVEPSAISVPSVSGVPLYKHEVWHYHVKNKFDLVSVSSIRLLYQAAANTTHQ